MKKLYLITLTCLALAAIFYTTKVKTKHVLFIVPGGTHVHPTLELAKELLNNHAKVTYFLFDKTSKEADTLRNIGVNVLSLPEEIYALNLPMNEEQKNILMNPISNYVDQPEGVADPSILSQYFMALFWDSLMAITQKINPSSIVYDVFLGSWGKYVGRALHIPAYASLAPAFSYGPYWKDSQFKKYLMEYYQKALPATDKRLWATNYLHEKLGSLAQDINVDLPVAFSDSQYATLIYSYPIFIDYQGEKFLNTNLIFTGYPHDTPDAPNTENQHIINEILGFKQNKKLVFISMGTVSNKPIEFFTMIGEALGNGGKNKTINDNIVVALHPGYRLEQLKEKYDAQLISHFMQQLGHTNFIVYDYFPLASLFKDIDIFIGHGGNNSSMQALQEYVPMVLLPIHGDQLWIGKTFQDFNLAQTIPADINPMLLKDHFTQWAEFTSSNKRAQFIDWIQNAVANILNNPDEQKTSAKRKEYIDSLLQQHTEYEKIIQYLLQSDH